MVSVLLRSSAVQWDAMTFFTESVFGQLFKILEKEVRPTNFIHGAAVRDLKLIFFIDFFSLL